MNRGDGGARGLAVVFPEAWHGPEKRLSFSPSEGLSEKNYDFGSCFSELGVTLWGGKVARKWVQTDFGFRFSELGVQPY